MTLADERNVQLALIHPERVAYLVVGVPTAFLDDSAHDLDDLIAVDWQKGARSSIISVGPRGILGRAHGSHHPIARLQKALRNQTTIALAHGHKPVPGEAGKDTMEPGQSYAALLDVYEPMVRPRSALRLAAPTYEQMTPRVESLLLTDEADSKKPKAFRKYESVEMPEGSMPFVPDWRAHYADKVWSFGDMRAAFEAARPDDKFFIIAPSEKSSVYAILPTRPT